ncbi:MAG: hypothetical protein GXN93_01720 [Candidatus Diapherotrites archaeon]|nr:hypothetical protein [Candidatus Diapherotrites archaeon]
MVGISSDVVAFVRREWLLSLYSVLFVILLFTVHPSLPKLVSYLDFRVLFSIFGFLLVVRALDDSGFLHWISHRLARFARSARGFAVISVVGTVALAALVTNDLALFAFVPIVLAAPLSEDLRYRILVLLALASNVGAFVSPVGNPQKLMLWQMSGRPFFSFLKPFLVPFAVIFAALIAYTWLLVRSEPFDLRESLPKIHRRAAIKDSILFVGYLVLLVAGLWQYAVALAVVYFALTYRKVFRHVDWAFLALISVLFLDFGMISSAFNVNSLLPHGALSTRRGVFATAAGLTQIMSDVPTAVLLSKYTTHYVPLAMGTTVGAMGLIVASVANIIAVRLSSRRRKYLLFHKYSLPFAIFAFFVVWVFL